MRILLAVDVAEPLNATTDALIAQFAPAEHDVRVFHAADWERHLPAPYMFAEGPQAARAVLDVRDELLRAAETHVERVATRLRAAGFTVTTEVAAEGNPRHAIVAAAKAWPADLIVIGSHGRTGLERRLEGSVSEGIVRHAPCSVEVVRLGATAQGQNAKSA